MIQQCYALNRLESNLLGNVFFQLADGHTDLLHGVAVTHGHAVIGFHLVIADSLEVHGDDEPMNGLDKHGVAEMRELFKKLADEGRTIIMANHSAEDIEALCDTVCEMDLGVLERIK